MYLSKIYIKNFRGIKELLVEFDKKLNVIIGANGQLKTSWMRFAFSTHGVNLIVI